MKRKTKKTKKKNSTSFFKITIFFLSMLVFILSGFIGGYLLNEQKTQKEIKKYQNTLQILQNKINTLSKEIKKNNINKKSLSQQNISPQNTEIIDYLESKKHTKTIIPPIIKTPKNQISQIKKPKLVIIIDDVAFKYEVNLIKQIPYHITPSFFPPTKNHPYTPIYAKDFPDYMIHVPMQAFNFAHPEPKTLLVTSSYNTIKKRIDTLKKDFPKAKFINNHTGSKFTANYAAMKRLFEVLKEDHLGFVDSKTTALSKGSEVDKIYKIPFFSRNIFLDDKENPQYIRNQLKKAIKIAKKRGYAIAIGHPHKITLLTLKNSKDLLNQVDVVYIDELAKDEKNKN